MAKLATEWDNVPGFDPINQTFERLDLEQWLKDHRILEEARSEGKRNKPSAGEQKIAGTPEKIAAWVNRRGLICRQNVSRHLEDLERNLADMESPELLLVQEQEVRKLLGNAELALEGKVKEGRNSLHGLEQDLQEEDRDFTEFRQENRLRRRPDYKHRGSALRYIVGCLIVEVLLNATLLMEVNAFGLLGSAVLMGMIGAVNVGVFAWCMGNALRQTAHVAVARKAMFSVLAVCIALGTGAFNLVVGHFRDSMQAVIGDPSVDIFSVGSDTFERFASGVVDFNSFQSGFLALIGFLFFFVAAWKWWQRDDPYPDYGRRHRRLQEKKTEYIDAFDMAQQALKGDFNAFQSKLEDIGHGLITKQTRWQDHCIQGKHIVENFATNLGQYQKDLEQLLGAYFVANRSTRTDPAPAWFSDRVEVNAEILVPPSFNPPAQHSLKGVADKVDEAIGALQSKFRSARQRFRTVEEVLASHGTQTEGRQ